MTAGIIHKEHFEHWLFSQEDSRSFNYWDTNGCLGCMFIRETTKWNNAVFGLNIWETENGAGSTEVPQFLVNLITEVVGTSGSLFTIADAKRAWLKLFPETEVNIQPAQSVKEVR